MDLRPRLEVAGDIKSLPTRRLQAQALRYIKSLRSEPMLGKPLGYLASVGNLSDCRKLYFAEGREAAPTHRIVYRLLPDEDRPRVVDVIAVGPRAGYKAYRAAVARLERI